MVSTAFVTTMSLELMLDMLINNRNLFQSCFYLMLRDKLWLVNINHMIVLFSLESRLDDKTSVVNVITLESGINSKVSMLSVVIVFRVNWHLDRINSWMTHLVVLVHR